MPCWSCRILYITFERLTFYRSSGGDWTARRVRETHTHRNLFFYGDYPDTVLNFADMSIYPELAREMVFEATRVLPVLGDPTPAMVGIFTRQLGWELRDSSRPVVNVWSTFIVSEKGEQHVYAIGGVMLMGVGSVWLLSPLGSTLGPVLSRSPADSSSRGDGIFSVCPRAPAGPVFPGRRPVGSWVGSSRRLPFLQ